MRFRKVEKIGLLTLDEFMKNQDYFEFREKTNKLAELDLSTKTHDQITKIITQHSTFTPNIWVKQRAKRFNKHTFYRVRLNINELNENINLINTFSYPHSSFCSNNGRANTMGTSVFYCSDDPITALTESKPKKGDVGFMSIWKPIATSEIIFAFCLSFKLRTDNKWSQILTDIIPSVRKYLGEKNKIEQSQIIAMTNLIAYKYINEKEPYSLTSWFSNKYLFGKYWHDLIIYPSTTSNSRFCNMAFHPNSADNNLRLEKVIKFKIINIAKDKIEYSSRQVGEVKNSRIHWRKGIKEEKDFSKF